MTSASLLLSPPSAKPDTVRFMRFRETIERLLNEKPVWSAALAVLFVLQLALIWTHEPWLDEWQALQIALQSPDLSALMENLRYEGHPPLWYLMLRGAAIFVPPAMVLPVVQTVMAMAIQSLIQFKAPFTRLERLLLGSSFFVLFDYGTLSRSLSLGVMLLITAFAYRRHAIGWAAIALLPFADFLFGILSLVCVVLRIRDKDIRPVNLTIWALCGLASAISVLPAKDMIPALVHHGLATDTYLFLTRLSVLLLPLHGPQYGLQWNQPLPEMIAVVAGPLFLWLGVRLTGDAPINRVIFLGFAAFLFAFSIGVYPLAIRHLSLLALVIIMLRWWSHAQSSRQGSQLFMVWIAAASACGLITAAVNLVRPFDTAKEAAAYIRDEGLQDKHWLSFPDSRGQGVSALLGMEFERLERDCTQSFIRWNYRSTIEKQEDLDTVLSQITSRYGRVYMLSDVLIQPDKNAAMYRLLKHIPAGYDGQDYYLWMIAPQLKEKPTRPPRCAPARLPMQLVH